MKSGSKLKPRSALSHAILRYGCASGACRPITCRIPLYILIPYCLETNSKPFSTWFLIAIAFSPYTECVNAIFKVQMHVGESPCTALRYSPFVEWRKIDRDTKIRFSWLHNFFGCVCSPKSKTKKKRKGIVETVLDSIDGRLRVHLYPSNVKKSKKKSKVQNELRLVLI